MGSGQLQECDSLTEGAWGVLDKFEKELAFYILAFQETEIRWREDEKMTLQVKGKRKCYGRSKMQAQLEKMQLAHVFRAGFPQLLSF